MQTETHVDAFQRGLQQRPQRLNNLTDWSIEHIRAVFEARTDDDSLRAIESTFSERLEGTVNGAPLSRPQVAQMVLAMRSSAPYGLRVDWMQAQEMPKDLSCRDGTLGGMYVIRGIQRSTPSGSPACFERHKTVAVRIESELQDPLMDSRRITSLVFVASDVRVDRQTAL
ncbi:hypothetical protein HDZ31DRAFT_48477 [Schizophyllum fasciatum]